MTHTMKIQGMTSWEATLKNGVLTLEATLSVNQRPTYPVTKHTVRNHDYTRRSLIEFLFAFINQSIDEVF